MVLLAACCARPGGKLKEMHLQKCSVSPGMQFSEALHACCSAILWPRSALPG